MDFVCGTLVPVFFTVVLAWMVCTLISMAWLMRQLRDDMRREDLEQISAAEERRADGCRRVVREPRAEWE